MARLLQKIGFVLLGAVALSAACAVSSDETDSNTSDVVEDCTEEICGDGLDNDCDGKADEDCTCAEGETQSCYTGPPATADLGMCRSGNQTCSEDSTWGDCIGDIGPTPELCDKLDNDCDGIEDEDCYPGNDLDNGDPCTADEQCFSGNCECGDFECAQRFCAADDCLCGYGTSGSCDDPLTGYVDPEDCDGADEICGEIDECLAP